MPVTVSTEPRTERTTRSVPIEVHAAPIPLLPRYEHVKKPKLTIDPDDVDYNTFDKSVTSVCDNSDFVKPLSRQSFHVMTNNYKYNFIKFNYHTLSDEEINRCVSNYRFYAYLYNNCSINDLRRENMANVIKQAM